MTERREIDGERKEKNLHDVNGRALSMFACSRESRGAHYSRTSTEVPTLAQS